jgi:hypothetical protein
MHCLEHLKEGHALRASSIDPFPFQGATKKVARMVTILTYIQEVTSLNLGQDADYPD